MNALAGRTPAQMIEEYIALREARKIADERFAAWRKENYDIKMDDLERDILNGLNALGVQSIKASSGTAYKKITTSVTIEDPVTFRRHVIGSEAWDLADWRANRTTINAMIEAGEAPPPGVKHAQFASIGIRKASNRAGGDNHETETD
jgi:hypothetical protein